VQDLHLPAWQMVPRARLVAACDTNPHALAALKTIHPSAELYQGLDDFVRDVPSMDFVVLATPGFTHATLGEQILDSGVHLLCEKPLALDLASARRLYGRAERKGRLLTAIHNYRFKDNTLHATSRETRKALGHVAYVNVRFRSGSLFDEGPSWMTDERTHRVLLFEMAYHMIDIAMLFLGSLTELRFADAELDSLGIGYVTFGTLHQSRARGLFELILDASSKSTSIEVLGEDQGLSLEFYPEGFRLLPRRDNPLARCLADATRVVNYGLSSVRERFLKAAPNRIQSHARLFAGFVDAVLDGGPNPIAPAGVLETITLLDAVVQRVYPQDEPFNVKFSDTIRTGP